MFYERFIGVEIPSSKISVYSQAKTESKPIAPASYRYLDTSDAYYYNSTTRISDKDGDMYIKNMINTQVFVVCRKMKGIGIQYGIDQGI